MAAADLTNIAYHNRNSMEQDWLTLMDTIS